MNVLICGDRNYTDRKTIKNYLETLPKDTTIISGGCRGADTIAEEEAKMLGLRTKIFYADWKKYGRSAGPKRNAKMLSDGMPTIVTAFHDDLEKSKGTKDMVTRAFNADIVEEIILFESL